MRSRVLLWSSGQKMTHGGGRILHILDLQLRVGMYSSTSVGAQGRPSKGVSETTLAKSPTSNVLPSETTRPKKWFAPSRKKITRWSSLHRRHERQIDDGSASQYWASSRSTLPPFKRTKASHWLAMDSSWVTITIVKPCSSLSCRSNCRMDEPVS